MNESGEKFMSLEVDKINNTIAQFPDYLSPLEILDVYYRTEAAEGEEITTHEDKISKTESEVTLVHSGLQDDSVESEKYVLTAKLANGEWMITKIQKNWKCQLGRGHQEFGVEPCE